MSKHNFTPGPWVLKSDGASGNEIWADVDLGRPTFDGAVPAEPRLQPIYHVNARPQLIVSDEGNVHAQIVYESWRQFPSTNFKETQEANARLIAAAPELLERLKDARTLLLHRGVEVTAGGIIERIDRVIAKAEKP